MDTIHHFLDTNIILAMVLNDDKSYDDAKNYFEFKSVHYISNTASDEAKFKINNDKRIFLDLVDFIKDFTIKNHINLLKLEKYLFIVEKSFLKQYD